MAAHMTEAAKWDGNEYATYGGVVRLSPHPLPFAEVLTSSSGMRDWWHGTAVGGRFNCCSGRGHIHVVPHLDGPDGLPARLTYGYRSRSRSFSDVVWFSYGSGEFSYREEPKPVTIDWGWQQSELRNYLRNRIVPPPATRVITALRDSDLDAADDLYERWLHPIIHAAELPMERRQ